MQGLVSVLNEGSRVAMVEVNCETDFVARNKDFQALLPIVTRAALEHRIRTGQHELEIEGLSSHVMGGKKVTTLTCNLLYVSFRHAPDCRLQFLHSVLTSRIL